LRRFLFATTAAIVIGGPAPAKENRFHASAPPSAAKEHVELSKADYVRLLGAEIRRHAPRRVNILVGSADVVFTIGASGRVAHYELKSVTNRKEIEPFVRRIMAAIRTPPPPGGSFEATQSFRFGEKQ
jgi:outer membrane biosynthesis protein TonB